MQSPFISTYNTKIKLPTHTIGSLNIKYTYTSIYICLQSYSNALNAHMKQRKSIAEKIYLIKFY